MECSEASQKTLNIDSNSWSGVSSSTTSNVHSVSCAARRTMSADNASASQQKDFVMAAHSLLEKLKILRLV